MLCGTLGYREAKVRLPVLRSSESNVRDPKVRKYAAVCTMLCANGHSGEEHTLPEPPWARHLIYLCLNFLICDVLWEYERSDSFRAVWGKLPKEMTIELSFK